MLSNDVYRECVKALAYGKTPKEIAQVMSVDERDVKAIPHSHVKDEEVKKIFDLYGVDY